MCLCCEAEDYGCSLLTKLALTNTLFYIWSLAPKDQRDSSQKC